MMLPGLLRSTEIPPKPRMSGPRQPVKRVCFPSHLMATLERQQMASMKTKSQFEVCGAPTMIRGKSGCGSLTRVQRLKRQYVRAMLFRIIF